MEKTESKLNWIGCFETGTFSRLLIDGLTVLLACGAVSAQQQPRAVWEGTLRNAAGAPIANTKILLVGGTARDEATTGGNGTFRVSALPGQYRLTVVEADGRRDEYTRAIEVAPAGSSVVVTLSGRGEVTVAALPQKERSATGGEQLSSQAVSELPLNKRDFSSLLLLAAGTMTDTNGATNFTQQFAINGQRGVEATFAMDDADISDPEMGGSTFSNFDVDAVESIDSSSGWMPAEIGR